MEGCEGVSQAGVWGKVPEELELGLVCGTPRRPVWLEWSDGGKAWCMRSEALTIQEFVNHYKALALLQRALGRGVINTMS